jgi:S-methylmethionine-dependent homocysteine/selenocysteine methylase
MAADVDEVVAVGVNCTEAGEVAELVSKAAQVSGLPGVAYPNSGEAWDAASRSWVGPGSFAAADVVAWRDAGARLVGGCCRVTPADITQIATALRNG